jgi:hypothetical protein
MVFKFKPANGSTFPQSFQNLMSLAKSVITYKHSTLG